MIDLHLHTFFSDGKIADVKKILQSNDVISITDHNTIQAYKYYVDELVARRFIIGCEVTVEGAPDYLLYFPNTFYREDLENDLKRIRLAEEHVIKNCYYSLGYCQWEKDIKVAFAVDQKLKNARTRDLAAIIHLYRTGLEYDDGKFDICDLNIARKQRRIFTNTVGKLVSDNIAFELAEKYNGEIVLAHPIHTAIKMCSRDNAMVSVVIKNLQLLLKIFINKGGKYVEWEYLREECLMKYALTINDIKQLRSIVKDVVVGNGLEYTIGTDSHSLDDYDEATSWLISNMKFVEDKLAAWINID